jgi:predicted nuclease of predicted toxin-antitoxin system
MKLYDFPLLADENIFRVLVDHLRNQDFDVVSIRELELLGIKDTDILTLANKNGRVVVTQDNDFGKIVLQRRPILSESFI